MVKRGFSEHIFDTFNIIFMIFVIFLTFYPFYYIICASFSENSKLLSNMGFLWWPAGFNTGAYSLTFRFPLVRSGYRNILFILAAALPINFVITVCCAYLLAAKNLKFKKPIVFIVMFTMFFSGGLIPSFLNIRSLGLYNSLWALIIPGSLSVYNAIITKTAMEAIPDSLSESARIDGANDIYVLVNIILPLITPTLAVIILYYAVEHWNSWFGAVIYLQDNDKLPIQAVLRSILIENNRIINANNASIEEGLINQFAETIKYALIIIGTVPVLVIYPFAQRYFIKGVMIGAIKG